MEGKYNSFVAQLRLTLLFVLFAIVEYWRNRTQRMNKERFLAANTMALVTHGIVSPFLFTNIFLQYFRSDVSMYIDATFGSDQD